MFKEKLSPSHNLQTGSEVVVDRLDPIFKGIQWPLKFYFKIFVFSSEISVQDSSGKCLVYAKQKLFNFREHVELFTDQSLSTKLGDIRADKVIDWSARYNFSDNVGEAIGCVGRKGWRSIWRANYEVFNPGDSTPDFHIREENPMAKVFDSLLGQIPILGLLTSFLFHPRYLAIRKATNQPTFRLVKKAAFFQGKFEFYKLGEATAREVLNAIFSFIMLALLERKRG